MSRPPVEQAASLPGFSYGQAGSLPYVGQAASLPKGRLGASQVFSLASYSFWVTSFLPAPV